MSILDGTGVPCILWVKLHLAFEAETQLRDIPGETLDFAPVIKGHHVSAKVQSLDV
jgi:hypothetical protein